MPTEEQTMPGGYNPAMEAMRQQTQVSQQDKVNNIITPEMQTRAQLIKAANARDAMENNEDQTATWNEETTNQAFQNVDNASTQIRQQTGKQINPGSVKTVVNPNPKPQPKPETIQQVQAVAENNPQVDSAIGAFDQAVTDEIEEDLNNGNVDENGMPNVPKTKERFKKQFPWDVLLTAISGVGAMLGLTPFMDFTQMGFEVSNNRNVRKAFAEGQAEAMKKAAQGEVIQNEKNNIDAYTGQRAEENRADNAAASDTAYQQMQASLEQLGMTLSSQEKQLYAKLANDKEMLSMTNALQKELTDKGYVHSKEMVDLMAGAQFKAFLEAKAKDPSIKTYADFNRSAAGRASWEAQTDAATKMIDSVGGAVGNVVGAVNPFGK